MFILTAKGYYFPIPCSPYSLFLCQWLRDNSKWSHTEYFTSWIIYYEISGKMSAFVTEKVSFHVTTWPHALNFSSVHFSIKKDTQLPRKVSLLTRWSGKLERQVLDHYINRINTELRCHSMMLPLSGTESGMHVSDLVQVKWYRNKTVFHFNVLKLGVLKFLLGLLKQTFPHQVVKHSKIMCRN